MYKVLQLFLLIALMSPWSSAGQCQLATVQKSHPLPSGENAVIDYFGKLYYYDSDVLRLKDGVQTEAEYSKPFLGTIDAVRVGNPLQILVQYFSSNTLSVLDKRLNTISEVDFNQTQPPFLMGSAVLTEDDHLWVHNTTSNTLLRLGLADLRVDNSTADLSLLFGGPFECDELQAFKYGVLLVDHQRGFMLLDNRGSLIAKEETGTLNCINVLDDKILLGKADKLYIRSANNPPGSWDEIEAEAHFQAVYVTSEAVVLHCADQLIYYELPDCFFEN